eukprot:Seg664.3 transcript_id=Seg664.3/GoldUCD/mRNA.D3Y31 product="hypothetical protein" protein_id=Seg664.3/GoldUCD/D3Y31
MSIQFQALLGDLWLVTDSILPKILTNQSYVRSTTLICVNKQQRFALQFKKHAIKPRRTNAYKVHALKVSRCISFTIT